MYLPGKFVRIKNEKEIFDSLDNNSSFEKLPFMPEMLEFCGSIFQIQSVVNKTCYEHNGLQFGEFPQNNVVTLKNVRCNGAHHADCQRGCLIFWKTEWLELVEDNADCIKISTEEYKTNLKIKSSPYIYFCQMTESKNFLMPINKNRKVVSALKDFVVKNVSLFGLFRNVLLPVYLKLKGSFFFILYKQPEKVSDQSLNLKSSDIIKVKTLREIIKTLDSKGKNRGLSFNENMMKYCGKKFSVKDRIEKIILGSSGEIMDLKNTVLLKEVEPECYHVFGNCPKRELTYWREIWLEKVTE
jgi:hypothetical protein